MEQFSYYSTNLLLDLLRDEINSEVPFVFFIYLFKKKDEIKCILPYSNFLLGY
jgi:hypothetical protein